jgi:ABC-type transport system involved in multi-copper enzyme maturation permease subunit
VFLWVASFCVMLLFLGMFDIALPLGALAVLVVLLCGMMTGVLPRESLPSFWADWIAPWAPQAHVGDGLRAILYRDADLMPRGTGGLLWLGGAGLAALALACLIPSRGAIEDSPPGHETPGRTVTSDTATASGAGTAHSAGATILSSQPPRH